jgi:hypothetical protein
MVSIYEPLPLGAHIRILELQVGQSLDELSCEFKIICLDDSDHEEFTALSYAWDPPVAPDATIKFPNGQSLPLSRTLTHLFATLRGQGNRFKLWIDALCINQEDVSERASQVTIMGQVYSSAKQVLLWLGPSNPTSQVAFRFMDATRKLSWPDGWEEPLGEDWIRSLEYVLAVLSRKWFRRVWVIQEVTLNKNVLMMCGTDSIGFDTFRQSVDAIWKFFDHWGSYGSDDPQIRGLWAVTELISIRDEFLSAGFVPYETLFQAAFHFEATDQRDAVFAFRGIADKGRPVPEPNYMIPIGKEPEYSISVLEVYRNASIALLCHGPSLDLLALAGTGRPRSPRLPTWVPDLQHFCFGEPFIPCTGAGWNAGGLLHSKPMLVSPNKIRIQLGRFDLVDVVCPVFDSFSVPHQKITMEQVSSLRPRLPEVSDEAWLESLSTNLIFGLDIDDKSAGPEYRVYFNEWLQWLNSSFSDSDLDRIGHNKYYRTLNMRIDGWRAFNTKGGLFCIGPPDVAAGDLVCVVPGCRFPLIMRPKSGTPSVESEEEFILVSWCYADGLMHSGPVDPNQAFVNVLLC